MAKLGVRIGDWLSYISDNGPVKGLRIRVETAIKENPFKDYYLECLQAAEAGKKEFRKPGKFVECQEMIKNFDDEKILVEFKGHSINFSWK